MSRRSNRVMKIDIPDNKTTREEISILSTSVAVSPSIARKNPRKAYASSRTTTPVMDPPVKIEFNKVYDLPGGLGKDDIGSLWFCDRDRRCYVWTAEGWSVYDGGEKGGSGSAAGAVLYDRLQSLSDLEKGTARENISAIADVPGVIGREYLSQSVIEEIESAGTKAFIIDYGCGSDVVDKVVDSFINDDDKCAIFIRIDTDTYISADLKSDSISSTITIGTASPNIFFTLRRYVYAFASKGWYIQTFENIAKGGVSYKPMSLEDEQKTQARTNINAASADDLTSLKARMDSLDDELHPWEMKSFSGGGTYEKYTDQNITFIWKTGFKGQSDTALPDETYWNGVKIDNSPQSRQVAISNGQGAYTYTLRMKRGSKDLSASRSAQFVCRSYWGAVAADVTSLDESSMKSLGNNSLRTGRGGTYANVTLNNQKVVWCYPKDFGTITKILDGNNFDLTDSFTRGELTTSKGDVYYVYILSKPVTNTGLKFTFS